MNRIFVEKMWSQVSEEMYKFMPDFSISENGIDILWPSATDGIIDVCSIVGDQGTEEDRNEFFKYIAHHILATTGEWHYGVRFDYNADTKMISVSDQHLCEISVENRQNRPIAYASFVPQIKWQCDNVKDAETKMCSQSVRMPLLELIDLLHTTPYTDLKDGQVYDHIMNEQIRFVSSDVYTFYSFTDCHYKTKSFIRLTNAMREAFADSPYQDLYRHTINETSRVNEYGFNCPVWSVYLRAPEARPTKEEIHFIAYSCCI